MALFHFNLGILNEIFCEIYAKINEPQLFGANKWFLSIYLITYFHFLKYDTKNINQIFSEIYQIFFIVLIIIALKQPSTKKLADRTIRRKKPHMEMLFYFNLYIDLELYY